MALPILKSGDSLHASHYAEVTRSANIVLGSRKPSEVTQGRTELWVRPWGNMANGPQPATAGQLELDATSGLLRAWCIPLWFDGQSGTEKPVQERSGPGAEYYSGVWVYFPCWSKWIGSPVFGEPGTINFSWLKTLLEDGPAQRRLLVSYSRQRSRWESDFVPPMRFFGKVHVNEYPDTDIPPNWHLVAVQLGYYAGGELAWIPIDEDEVGTFLVDYYGSKPLWQGTIGTVEQHHSGRWVLTNVNSASRVKCVATEDIGPGGSGICDKVYGIDGHYKLTAPASESAQITVHNAFTTINIPEGAVVFAEASIDQKFVNPTNFRWLAYAADCPPPEAP